jgi:hypothetical protein
MKSAFTTIEDLFNEKRTCPFCGNNLIYKLTNFIGFRSNGDAIIESYEKDGIFYFELKNLVYDNYINNNVFLELNIKNNKLNIKNNINDINAKYIQSFFEKLAPHIDASCLNNRCKRKYYYNLKTSVFECTIKDMGIDINPFRIDFEHFIINKYWVINNFKENYLKIYKKNQESSPIIHEALDLTKIKKNKIKEKIITIISFS